MINGFVDEVNKVYDEIEKNKKQIESILKREEVLIFEEFKHVPHFEQKAEELKKKSEEIIGEY